jgi:hypothetical protein
MVTVNFIISNLLPHLCVEVITFKFAPGGWHCFVDRFCVSAGKYAYLMKPGVQLNVAALPSPNRLQVLTLSRMDGLECRCKLTVEEINACTCLDANPWSIL